MIRNKKQGSAGGAILLITVLLNAIILEAAYTGNNNWYWALLMSAPLLLIAIQDRWQEKHVIRRNVSLIGHLRYFFGAIRPEIRQYFFKPGPDDKPLKRQGQMPGRRGHAKPGFIQRIKSDG